MPSIDEQVHEYFELAADLEAGTQVMQEVAEENMRKRKRYLNLRESSDLTADEAIQANDLRVEANEELEELHALRKDLVATRERMNELGRSLEAAGFWA